VSAANADDRNAAFEGSKRVRIFLRYLWNMENILLFPDVF
jgi:hypothetical protein